MESQMHRPHAHVYDEDPHAAGERVEEGEEEHHHEKKSVLKKVKAKAKKIKETLKMHGHAHDHHESDDDDSDVDEEMMEDPEVHGAPIYESAALRSGKANLEKPTMMAEDRYELEIFDPPARPLSGQQGANLGRPTAARGVSVPEGEYMSSPAMNIGRETALEEDPQAPRDRPPSNYQAKVVDPTNAGAEEAGITPILQSFSKMGVQDDKPGNIPKPELESGREKSSYTGTHDQMSPEPLPAHTTFSPVTSLSGQKGYNGKAESGSGSASATEYTHKIASTVTEKLAPVYGKVAGAGSSVISKVKGTGTGQETGEKGADKGVSVKEYLVEKFRPGEEDKALSEAISEALHKRIGESEGEGDAGKRVRKVTESEEVARRLGGGSENSGGGSEKGVAGNVGVGKGVVDRLRGAVGSWFGRGDESSQGSLGTTYVGEERSSDSGGGEVGQEQRHQDGG